MNKNSFFIILMTVLAVLILAFGSVSAQDVDVDNLSNEQLMMLLQSIMQKLEADTNAEPTEQAPETESEAAETQTAEEPIPEPTEMTKPAAEKKQFQIYENKKLVIGRMPDSWFIRKPVQSGGGSDEDDSDDDRVEYYDSREHAYTRIDPSYTEIGTWGGISGGISSYAPEYNPFNPMPAPGVTGGSDSMPVYVGGSATIP